MAVRGSTNMFNRTTPSCNDKEQEREFYALVNITRLVAGQVININPDEADPLEERDDLGECDNDDSNTSGISDSDELDALSTQTNSSSSHETLDRIYRKFLDRFAEASSRSKGPLFITNTSILEQKDGATLYVSCNEAFNNHDREFFTEAEACLRSIAREDDPRSTESRERLWQCLIEQQSDRLERVYIPDVSEGLRAMIKDDKLPQLSCACEESHRILKRLKDHFIDPKQQTSQVPSNSMVILEALKARRSPSVRDCLTQHKDGLKLWGKICFLARVRAAYECFIEMSTICPAIKFVTITPVVVSNTQHEIPVRPLDLDQCLNSFWPSGKAATAKPALVSSKMRKKFDEFCKDSRHMHSEVQMMLFLAQRGSLNSVYSYMGGSRYCCFLCWKFIRAFSRLETRGCHYKLYHKWMLPKIDSVPEETRPLLKQTTESLQLRLHEIIQNHRSRKPKDPRAESSAGITSFTVNSGPSNGTDEFKRMWEHQSTELQHRRRNTSLDEPLGQMSLDDEGAPQRPVLAKEECVFGEPCIMCGARKASLCERCRSVNYCGSNCQRLDWRLHKTLCAEMQIFLSTRPSQNHRVAVSLPEQDVWPIFVWVECERRWDEFDCVSYESLNLRSLLGSDDYVAKSAFITRNARRGYDIGRVVEIKHRDAFLLDGSLPNRCVIELTRGARIHDWRGPLVVMVQQNRYDIYCDVSLADLRIAVDYFISYADDWVTHIEGDEQISTDSARGVKITCRGDQSEFGWDPFVAVAVPRRGQIFLAPQSRPSLPRRLGVSLRVSKCQPDQAWIGNKSATSRFDNVYATFLHLDCNPQLNNEAWGWAPPEWQNKVGSVVVVREDGEDLTPRQVEALCVYCRQKLGPLFDDAIGAGTGARSRSEIMNFITPQAFAKFFTDFRDEKKIKEPSWKDEHCPVESVLEQRFV